MESEEMELAVRASIVILADKFRKEINKKADILYLSPHTSHQLNILGDWVYFVHWSVNVWWDSTVAAGSHVAVFLTWKIWWDVLTAFGRKQAIQTEEGHVSSSVPLAGCPRFRGWIIKKNHQKRDCISVFRTVKVALTSLESWNSVTAESFLWKCVLTDPKYKKAAQGLKGFYWLCWKLMKKCICKALP